MKTNRLGGGLFGALACSLLLAAAAAGGYQAGPQYSTPSPYPMGGALADLNGDGKVDLVDTSWFGSIDISTNNGAGTFSSAATGATADDGAWYPQILDLNGDSKPDIVFSTTSEYGGPGYLDLLVQGASFTYTLSHTGVLSGPTPPAMADFNGDGKLDFVVGDGFTDGSNNWHGYLTLLIGNGQGHATLGDNYFYGMDASAQAVAAGDFDHDGKQDVALVDSNNELIMFWGNGDGTFTIASPVALGAEAGYAFAPDLEKHGTPDLVLGFPATGSIQVLQPNGDRTFTALDPVPAGVTYTARPALADLNGDGALDVVVPHGNQVTELLGDGHGHFEAADTLTYPSDSAALDGVAVGDVNGDKLPDIAAVDVGTYAVDFFYATKGSAPTIKAYDKSTARPTETVTITGTNLQYVRIVDFGDGQGTITQKDANGTFLKVTVPADATTAPITVVGDYGSVTGKAVFTPVQAPEITSFSPSPGTIAGGTVTISGHHFTGTTSVKVAGEAVTSFKVVSDSSITAVIPQDASSGKLAVSTGIDPAAQVDFVVITAPTGLSFTPTHGPANVTKTTQIHVTGQHLDGVTSVTVGGKPGTDLFDESATSVWITVAVGAKTGPVVLKNAAGTFTAPGTFTVDPQPTVTTVSPSPQQVGMSVTITGTNLSGATEVDFGSGEQHTVTPISSTQISVVVPGGAQTATVTVKTPAGSATSKTVFVPVATPHITSINPDPGTKVGGTLTINGTNLTAITAVRFGAVAAKSFKSVSDTQLTAVVPAGAGAAVTVTNSAGTDAHSFQLVVPPTIAATGSFAPTVGGASQAVVITGSGFYAVTGVNVGTKPADHYNVDSPTQITAYVAAGTAKGKVTVTNVAGSASSTDLFTVISVKSVTPASIGAGGTVTINGIGLSAVTAVRLHGANVDVTPLAGSSDTKLKIAAPACASSGTLTLKAGSVTVVTTVTLAYSSDGC